MPADYRKYNRAVSLTGRPGETGDEPEAAEIESAISDLKRIADGYAGISSGDNRRKAKGTILVVDDDRAFLEVAERLLAKENYRAIITDEPQSVGHFARTIQPAAILLDVLMPGFDGWDVMTMLKADASTKDIPVFMISIVNDKAKAKGHDADGFVSKPLDAPKLAKILRELEKLGSVDKKKIA